MHTETHEDSQTFETLGLSQQMLQTVKKAGFTSPSPIQSQAIPVLAQGQDVIGQAHTGTGKTAAFGLPSIDKIQKGKGLQMLVITPTRELAMQVSDELFRFGRDKGLFTVTVFGGQSYRSQLERIERGVEIMVATPGRLLDLLEKRKIKNFNPQTVVLDEADEMLNMGFIDDIRAVFAQLPKERQTLLFSATMPDAIRKLAGEILTSPKHIQVTDPNQSATSENITQRYCPIREHERDEAILRILMENDSKKGIIFCRTKREVDRLAHMLTAQGLLAEGLHGDIDQRDRNRIIKSFKNNDFPFLIATDVAARGLDIRDVTHVVNFHIPFDPESYVHRIGRTGRAGKKGTAITLVTPDELRDLQKIRNIMKSDMVYAPIPKKEVPEDRKIDTVLNTIKNTKIHPDAQSTLTTLLEKNDPQELMEKTISYLLENAESAQGNNVGLSEAEVEAMLKPKKRGDSGGRKGGYSSGGYKGRQNNKRGGGSRFGNSGRQGSGGRTGSSNKRR